MRGMMRLAIMGVPGAQSGAGDVEIEYLLLDNHITPLVAGAVDGTGNEPGPGARVVTDTNSAISITNERLLLNGSLVSGDGIVSDVAFSRAGGRAFGVTMVSRTTYDVDFRVQIATDATTAAAALYGAGPTSTGLRLYDGTNQVLSSYNFTEVAPICFAIIMRPTKGGLLFARNALTGDYTLLHVYTRHSASEVYLRLSTYAAATVNMEFDNRMVVDLAGDYAEDYGLASIYLAAPADGTTATQSADGHVTLIWTPGADEVLDIQVRGVDDDNCWIVRCTQATNGIALIQKELGTETVIDDTPTLSVTWTPDTPININVCMLDDKIAVNTQTGSDLERRHFDQGGLSFNQTSTRVKISGSSGVSELAIWPGAVALPSPFDVITLSDDLFIRVSQTTLWEGDGTLDWLGRATLCDLGGGVWAAVYRVGPLHAYDSSGEVHIRFSDDEGVTWTAANTYLDDEPVTGAPFPGAGTFDVDVPIITRAPNGDLLVLVGQKKGAGITGPAGVQQFRSLDDGATFADEGLVISDNVICNEVIIIGTDMYMAAWSDAGRSELWMSADNGETWSKVSNITDSGTDECTIAHLGGTTLLAMIRHTAADYTYQRISEDLGETWGTLTDVTQALGVLQRPRLHTFADEPNTLYLTARSTRPVAQTSVFFADKTTLAWSVPFYPNPESGGDRGYTDLLKRAAGDWYMLDYYGVDGDAAAIVEYVFTASE